MAVDRSEATNEILELFRAPLEQAAEQSRQLHREFIGLTSTTRLLNTQFRDFGIAVRSVTGNLLRQRPSSSSGGGDFRTLAFALSANTSALNANRAATDRLVSVSRMATVASGVSAASSASAASATTSAARRPANVALSTPVPAIPLVPVNETPQPTPRVRTAQQRLDASLAASRAAETRRRNAEAAREERQGREIPILEVIDEGRQPVTGIPLTTDNSLPLERINPETPTPTPIPTPTPTPTPTPIPTATPAPTSSIPVRTGPPVQMVDPETGHIESPPRPGESREDYERRVLENRRRRRNSASRTQQRQAQLAREAQNEARRAELGGLNPSERTPAEELEFRTLNPQPTAPIPMTGGGTPAQTAIPGTASTSVPISPSTSTASPLPVSASTPTTPGGTPTPTTGGGTPTPVPVRPTSVPGGTRPPTGGGGGGGGGRGGRSGAGLVGGPGPGGQPWAGGMAALVQALNINTAATNRNTSAIGTGLSNNSRILRNPTMQPRQRDRRNDDDLFEVSPTTFAAAGAAIYGLVSAASPSAISTFTGSLKILSSEIGNVFVPYVINAAYGMQDLANAFATVNPATKEAIGKVGIASVALLGLSMVGTRVATVFGALGGAILGVGKGLMWMVTSPIGLTITAVGALTAGLLTLTGSWSAVGDAANWAVGKMVDGVNAVPNPMGKKQDIGSVNLNFLPRDVQEQLRQPNAKIGTILAEVEKEQQERLKTLQATMLQGDPKTDQRQKIFDESANALAKRAESINKWINETPFGQISGNMIQDRANKELINSQQELREKLRASGQPPLSPFEIDKEPTFRSYKHPTTGDPQFQMVPGQKLIAPDRRNEGMEIEKLKKAIEGIGELRQKMGIDKEHLTDWKSPVKARYTDALAYRESVQLAALNVPETEADLIRRQMEEQLKLFGDNGPLIKAINNQTEELANALRQISPIHE